MSAGLPGLGLGGLFFIVSALAAPFVELYRTARGRSSAAAWRGVGRQFAIAAAMIVAIDLALRLAFLAVEATGIGQGPADRELTVLPLVPIGITLGLLAALLASAKAAQLVLRIPRGLAAIRPAATRPIQARVRVGAAAGLALSAWFALLVVGASDLSPISGGGSGSPQGEGSGPLASAPPARVDASSTAPIAGRDRASAPDVPPASESQPHAASARGESGDRGGEAAPSGAVGEEPGPQPQEGGAGGDTGAAPEPEPEPEPEAPPAEPATPPSEPPSEPAPPGGGAPEDAGPPAHAAVPPHAGSPTQRGWPATE